MQDLQDLQTKKNDGQSLSSEEQFILEVYELIQKYTPEDERPERELQLSLLLDDIKDSNRRSWKSFSPKGDVRLSGKQKTCGGYIFIYE